jgi:hypothetical protein
MPFFPRVLVHLVGLEHVVVQRVAVEAKPGVLLESVPPLQQVPPVTPQLPGHLRRGRALSDAAKDHQELSGAAMGPLQDGPGPGVEDPTAGAALVVQDRLAVTVMNPQALPLAASGTRQAVRVEQCDELGVAGVLIEIVVQSEVHGRNSVRRIGFPSRTTPPGAGVKWVSTELAP